MKTIEIVTHCYTRDVPPPYHRYLQLQLSSLLLHRNEGLHVTATVVYSPEDTKTLMVLEWFQDLTSDDPQITIKGIPQPDGELFRRAIGRNAAAQVTKADVVWFTDCDYIFHGSSLLQARDCSMASEKIIVYPAYTNINKTHVLGDAAVDELEAIPMCVAPLKTDQQFKRNREVRPIGGIQIVRGDYCREHGYLAGTKWMGPCDPTKGLPSFICDIKFRKKTNNSYVKVAIDNVYRVRHSYCGYDDHIHNETTEKARKNRVKQ